MSIFSLISFDTLSQPSWEISKNQDRRQIYTKDKTGSSFKAFKAVMIVEATSAEIVKIMKDADHYQDWYSYTKTSQLIKQEEGIFYTYVETIFPWPYSNRHMVYEISIKTTNSRTIEISQKGIPDYIPTKEGIVRMGKAKGYMLLQTLGDKTEITYVFHSEPGANVPSWLANKSITEMPFKTLSSLRNILKEQ